MTRRLPPTTASDAAPTPSATRAATTYPSVQAFSRTLGDVDWERSPAVLSQSGTLVAVADTPYACNFLRHVNGACSGSGRISLLAANADGSWRQIATLPMPRAGAAALGTNGYRGIQAADGGPYVSDDFSPLFVVPLAVSPTLDVSVVLGRLHGQWQLLRFQNADGKTSTLSNVRLSHAALIGHSRSCIPNCAASEVEITYAWDPASEAFAPAAPPTRRGSVTPGLLAALAANSALAIPLSELDITAHFDVAEPTWARLDLTGAPGYTDSIQGAAALAHKLGWG
jgi:hypothetical protein